MTVIIFILSLILGWGLFKLYHSIFNVVYVGYKGLVATYFICCLLAYLLVVIGLGLLLLLFRMSIAGIIASGIVALIIFILEIVLKEKMPFGVRDRVTQIGVVTVFFLGAIGYGVYFFVNDDEKDSTSPTVETQDSGADIITIGSNDYFATVEEPAEQGDSLGKYTGIQFVKQYDDVMGIQIIAKNRALVKKEENYAIYDETFNELQDLGNIEIEDVSNGFIFFSKQLYQDGSFNKAYGILDRDGYVVKQATTESTYEEVKSHYTSLMPTKTNNNVIEVETIYDWNTGLVGLKKVERDENGYEILTLSEYESEEINNSILIQPSYLDIQVNRSIRQEYAFKSVDGKWGILNLNEEIILEPIYSSIEYVINADEPYFEIYNEKGEKGIYTHSGWLFEPQIPYNSDIQYFQEYVIETDGFKTKIYDQTGSIVKEFNDVYQFSNVINVGDDSEAIYYIAVTSGKTGILDSNFNWVIDGNVGSNVYFLENEVFVSISDISHERLVKLYNEDGSMIEQLSIIVTSNTSDGFFNVSEDGENFIFGNVVYQFVANPNYAGSSQVIKEETSSVQSSDDEFTFDKAIEYAKQQYGDDEDTIYSIEDGIFYENGVGYCIISLSSKSMQEAGGSGFLLRVTVYEDGRIVE